MAKRKIKLDWVEDIEGGWTDNGVEEAKVWRTAYKNWDITVFPMSLIDNMSKGWEYRITNDLRDADYESIENSNGNDHAESAEKAMKWAKNTLMDIIKEKVRA